MPVTGSIEALVANSQFNEEETLAIAGLADGGWVILWASNETYSLTNYDVLGQVFNQDGTKRGAQFKTTTSEVGGTPRVTATGDGGFVVAWTGSASTPADENAYIRKYDSTGIALDPKILIDSGPFALVGTPELTPLSQDRWLVTYSGDGGGSQLDILQRVFAADASNSSGEVAVNTYATNAQSRPCTITLDDGGWVTVWQSVGQEAPTQSDDDIAIYGSGIYWQRFDATGAKVGAETHVNTTVEGQQADASITRLENGSWAIAWASTGQWPEPGAICFQVFDENGSPAGVETEAGATFWSDPNVTALEGGRFVLTWTGYGIGDATDVHQKLFEADGTPIGTETVVNTFTDYFQHSARVVALDGGGWVTVWTSGSQDDDEIGHPTQTGSGNGIYQQVFNADGTRDGVETEVVLVPQDKSHDDFQVALLDGGRAWTITWADHRFDEEEGESDLDSEQIWQRTFQLGTSAAPTDLELAKHTVTEGAAKGTKVGTVAATDVDSTRFNWWLLDDAGGRFAVNGETGKLTVNNGVLLDYEQATSHQVTVALSDGTSIYQETLTIDVSDAAPENIVGSKFSDKLVGGDSDDTLDGGSRGVDTLIGGGGRDHLIAPDKGAAMFIGGSGRDTLDGGNYEALFYRDTVDYSDKSAAIAVTLDGSHHVTVKVGGKAEDTIRNIENVIGGSGRDRLRGDDNANSLVGGNGKDTLFGGAGNDTLVGSSGKDRLYGSDGTDFLMGGGNRDTLAGGAGRDYFGIDGGTADLFSDFVHDADRIFLVGDSFFDAIGRKLTGGEFHLGKRAHDANDFIIYEQPRHNIGYLYFDADGDGPAQQAIIAILVGGPKLDAGDFVI